MTQYKLFPNFLSKEDNAFLMNWALSTEKWEKSAIMGEDVKDWRSSNLIYSDKDSEPKILIDQIIPMFSDLHKLYYGETKSHHNIEVQLTKSHDGDFYKVHQDVGVEGISKTRKLTYVYYMHKLPRQFIKGSIRIYESYDKSIENRLFKKYKYMDIEPLNNTLLVFPSHLWHEVLPVRCALDWTCSRFTINGWFH